MATIASRFATGTIAVLASATFGASTAFSETITAYTNTEQIWAQEFCNNEGNRGAYENALEWGRSGIFANVVRPSKVERFRLANLTLLQCIAEAKRGLTRDKAAGNTNFDLVIRPLQVEDRLDNYLSVGTASQLAEVGQFLWSEGRLEEASVALTVALERSLEPRQPGIRAPEPGWIDSLRLQLTELEFQLGDFASAANRARYYLAVLGENREAINKSPVTAVLGSALWLEGERDEALRLLTGLFSELQQQSTDRLKLAWDERPANTAQQYSTSLAILIRELRQLHVAGDAKAANLAFKVAQYASTGAISDAYEDLARRLSSQNDEIAQLRRAWQKTKERYDIEMHYIETELHAALLNGQPVPAPIFARLTEAKALRDKLYLGDQPPSDAPQATNLADPAAAQLAGSEDTFEAIALNAVQRILGPDETILFYFEVPGIGDFAGELHIWAISRETTQWAVRRFRDQGLAERIESLRCGLDVDAALSQRCATLTGRVYSADDRKTRLPSFDIALSHSLYNDVLPGEIRAQLKEKLIVVPSTSLVALPMDALVRSEEGLPDRADRFDDIDVPWLIETHATTFLPSLAGYKHRGSVASVSDPDHRLIAFGNPLLTGQPDRNPRHANLAATARLGVRCEHKARTESEAYKTDAVITSPASDISTDRLRQLVPLVETWREICDFDRYLAPTDSKLFLADDAREFVIKGLNAQGELRKATVLHFASHAVLSQEIAGINEPGIVLTPPEEGTFYDDGFLSASEIAALDIDAALVILSACNTAGGFDRSGAMLAGLARAFFVAGGRSLLVSHWATNSRASAAIVALMARSADQGTGLSAQSLRSAKLVLAEEGRVHPLAWSQFFMVGQQI